MTLCVYSGPISLLLLFHADTHTRSGFIMSTKPKSPNPSLLTSSEQKMSIFRSHSRKNNSLQVNQTCNKNTFSLTVSCEGKKVITVALSCAYCRHHISHNQSITTLQQQGFFFQRKCFDDEAGMRSKVIRTHLCSKAGHHDKNKH